MGTVTVHKARKYDITSDEQLISRRMWTQEGANRDGLEIIPGTGVEIDANQLETGEQFTPIDFSLAGS